MKKLLFCYSGFWLGHCSEKCISNENVERFVPAMDIGEIHDIPGYCGAARTGTALTTMIMDLHRSVSSLKYKLR